MIKIIIGFFALIWIILLILSLYFMGVLIASIFPLIDFRGLQYFILPLFLCLLWILGHFAIKFLDDLD